jgi:hypothetical protein
MGHPAAVRPWPQVSGAMNRDRGEPEGEATSDVPEWLASLDQADGQVEVADQAGEKAQLPKPGLNRARINLQRSLPGGP